MNYFDNYFNTKKKPNDKPKVIDQLLQVPKKDKGVNMPHFNVLKKNYVHQADLLYLPHDEDDKYLLVVVDGQSRITDAQPLTQKTSEATLEGFKKIYERGILKLPKPLDVDPGAEFKGPVAKWFKDQGIGVRVGKTGRHRMQALVERRNQIIGTAIAKRQAEEELLTGDPAVQWKDDIPELIKALNKRTTATRIKVKKPPEYPVCEGDSCQVLDRGAKVRVILEEPRSLQGRKLHGKFRAGDVRWEERIRTIKEI